MENVPLPDDTFDLFTNSALGEVIAWAPEGQGRVRTYFCYWDETCPRFQGPSDFARLLDSFEWTGISQRYFSAAKQAGPLATFEGADSWVERPYANGVALLGDAAANSDPSWWQGLSLALRGSRTLRDALLSSGDWDVSGRSYAYAIPLWPQTLEPACSARTLLRFDPRRCPLLKLFLERGELLAHCLQLSS